MEGRKFILQALLGVFIVSHVSSTSYLFTAPKEARAGSTYKVSVLLLKDSKIVVVELYKKTNDIAATSSVLAIPGTKSTVVLNIPADAEAGSYNLTVKYDSKVQASHSVKITRQSGIVLIQTDKGVYKPGKRVCFRCIALSPDMKPLDETFDVEIKDKDGNRIFMWKGVSGTRGDKNNPLYNMKGLLSDCVEIADRPVLGNWSIQCSVSSNPAISNVKNFKVEKYVLPRFGVKVDAPDAVAMVNSQKGTFQFKVDAKYTYGKPVSGKVTGVLTIAGQRRLLLQKTLQEDGTCVYDVTVDLNVIPYRSVYYKTYVNINVTVTENVSGRKENMTGKVLIRYAAYQMDFVNTRDYTTPGTIFAYNVRIMSTSGEPLTNLERNEMILMVEGGPTKSVNYTLPLQGDTLTVEMYIADGSSIYMKLFLVNKKTGKVEARNSKNFQSINTLSNDGITVDLLDSNLKPTNPVAVAPENNVKFRVQVATIQQSPSTKVFYEVYSLGHLIKDGVVDVVKDTISRKSNFSLYTSDFTLGIEASMVPEAVLVVYSMQGEGSRELVISSLKFPVSGIIKNKATLKFDKAEGKAKSKVTATVKGEPSAYVGLVAVDKSSLLLEEANDINRQQLMTELKDFDLTSEPPSPNIGIMFRRKKRDVIKKKSSYGFSTWNLLQTTGVIVMTDGQICQTDDNNGGPFLEMAFDDRFAPNVAEAAGNAKTTAEVTIPEDSGESQMRTHFPETWIWSDSSANQDGTLSLEWVLPDTITTWVTTAFTLGSTGGLDIPNKATVRGFQNFFIRMDLPYSMTRGEVCYVKIYLFNYNSVDITADLKILSSNEFKVWPDGVSGIELDDTSLTLSIEKTKRGTKVPANGSYGWSVPIKPEKLGTVSVTAEATASTGDTDALMRSVLVEPEGEHFESSKVEIVELDNNERTFTMAHTLPDMALVQGSYYASISVTGDMMGATLANLGRLIKQPYGCGEQNMISMVPNIYALEYLRSRPETPPAGMEDNAIKYMTSGYQRELKYKNKTDGSFSAFVHDKSGSVWLTAFVMQSFAKASKYITVDPNIISDCVKFLAKQFQATNNQYFREPGVVRHTDMLGGAAENDFVFSVYIWMSLLEVKEADILSGEDKTALQTIITQAQNVIESNYTRMNEDGKSKMSDYSLALLSYSFLLAKSSHKEAVFLLLMERAKTNVKGQIYWSDEKYQTQADSKMKAMPAFLRDVRTHSSTSVETSSYGLLVYALDSSQVDQIKMGNKIMKWMSTQMSHLGGYGSTQDTVVALSGLSKFSKLLVSYPINMEVTVTHTDPVSNTEVALEKITLNSGNKLLLQSRDVNNNAVQIKAVGKGLARVVLAWGFNVNLNSTPTDTDMQTNVGIIFHNTDSYIMEITAVYTGDGPGGMATIISKPFGGFICNEEYALVTNEKSVSMVETEASSCVLYIRDLKPNEEQKVRVKADKLFDVSNIQKALVTSAMYYTPDATKTVSYAAPDSINLSTCQLSNDKSCPRPVRNPQDPNSAVKTCVTVPFLVMVVAMAALLM